MNDLPPDRFDNVPAFTHCAVDLFGSFFIKDRCQELQRYGILCTCLTSHAIHLDTINSLDTDSFIHALRRFLSIRGPICTLRSDWGTNIIGALNQFQEINNSVVEKFILEQLCDYILNVPNASHQNGVWERQI